eukprot:CAMPEP_0175824594 /NCGR_PEP_ID=MMETSP0107_2-20121207/10808_1 /TAXON_ID=195067 ORGANISM="Goniomonas pacifica, Strain CCMP1869" /NCGR_SAMPLE_ID=MMETSP0107_2 /ASSEMBLY_ACC=CAM_ASM_000203 /LENGTH=35 /DNA_ID= /DNA_START= /DNA_END= /DNA_ORIENTATION=
MEGCLVVKEGHASLQQTGEHQREWANAPQDCGMSG